MTLLPLNVQFSQQKPPKIFSREEERGQKIEKKKHFRLIYTNKPLWLGLLVERELFSAVASIPFALSFQERLLAHPLYLQTPSITFLHLHKPSAAVWY